MEDKESFNIKSLENKPKYKKGEYYPFDYFCSDIGTVYYYIHSNKIDIRKYDLKYEDIISYLEKIKDDRDYYYSKLHSIESLFLPFIYILGCIFILVFIYCLELIIYKFVYYHFNFTSDDNMFVKILHPCSICLMILTIIYIFKNDVFGDMLRYLINKKYKKKSQDNPIIEKLIEDISFQEYMSKKQ